MIDVVSAVMSVALLVWSAVARPAAGGCPEAWYVNGVRPSGAYECLRAPGGDPLYDGAGGYPDRTVDRPGWLVGRVWCGTGAVPILVDERRAGCRR